MRGGRNNTGRVSVGLSGKLATRLGGATPGQVIGGQGQGQSAQLAPSVPAPQATRHQPATPNGPPRSGTREVARVDGQGLIQAGQQTGTPAQPAQAPQPSSSRPVVPPVYPGQMR